jgi:trimeric autotransporter adhesin
MNRITLAGAALLSLTAAASSQCWLPGPTAPGAVATTSVRALLRHDDGSGSKLYVGGLFDVFGGVDSGGLAVETPNGFAAVGGRRVAGDVRAMVEYGGDLIVGGQFSAIGETQAANLARWDGENWSPLGLGTDGLVAALAVYGGDLYAAGYFQNAGGAPASRIARWNGATWSAVGSGVDANVDALAVYQGDLFAAGAFLNAGGSSASRIAKWNGTSWASLSTGLGSGAAFALQVFDADGAGPAAPALFVGGGFYSAGGLVAHRVAAWDGSAWSAPVPSLGFSTSGAVVYGLGTDGASLFIGGSFVVGSAANVVKFASGAVSTLVLGGDGAQSTTYAFVHDGLGAIGISRASTASAPSEALSATGRHGRRFRTGFRATAASSSTARSNGTGTSSSAVDSISRRAGSPRRTSRRRRRRGGRP